MGKEQHENSNQSHGEFQREEAMPGNVLRIQDLWWLSLNDRDADGWALMLAGRGRGGCCILQAARGHGVAAGASPLAWEPAEGKELEGARGQSAPADGEHVNLSTAAGSLRSPGHSH